MPRTRSLLLYLAAILLAASCDSSDGDADREECDRLVDHLVDMQVRDSADRDPHRQAELARHRAALRDAIHERVVTDCLARPAAHTDCALRAHTSAALKECD
jgi:hypothetical protein